MSDAGTSRYNATTLSTLSAKQVGAFKILLLKERQRLLQSASETPATIVNRGEVHDRGEESTVEQITEVNSQLTTRRDIELRDTNIALQRISDGVYGVCINCGEDIGLARLQAYPKAKRCIRCKTSYEQELSGH